MAQAQFQQLAELIELPDSVVYGVANGVHGIFKPALDIFDAQLHAAVPQLAQWDQFLINNTHKWSKKLPLMTTSYVLFAMIGYFVALTFFYILGKVLGKRKQKPIGFLHNMFLYFLSAYMCVSIIITAVASGFRLWNNAVGEDLNGWRMAKLIWLFYVSKIPEFIDTCIMMLKQNYHQVSFLHLYHHTTIFGIWFIVCLMGPGGDAYWSAMLNSGIHVIMYGYYWGTMMFDEKSAVGRFLKAFKFMITKGQMTQFFLNCCQSVYLLVIVKQANYRSDLIHLLLWYMCTLLFLFGNFLIKGQRKAREERKLTDKKKK